MRIVAGGLILGMMVAGAAHAGSSKTVNQLDGDIARLPAGERQTFVIPLLVEGRQCYINVGLDYGADGRGPARIVGIPMDSRMTSPEEGSESYRKIVAEAQIVLGRLQAFFTRKAEISLPSSGAGTGAKDLYGTGEAGSASTSAPDASTPVARRAPPASRYPHEVTNNDEGTVTVRVTMPLERVREINNELRTIAANTQAVEVSPGTYLSSAQVQMVLVGANGSVRNQDGTVTRWRTYRVTP